VLIGNRHGGTTASYRLALDIGKQVRTCVLPSEVKARNLKTGEIMPRGGVQAVRQPETRVTTRS